jgi:hypothetical protein
MAGWRVGGFFYSDAHARFSISPVGKTPIREIGGAKTNPPNP